MKNSPYKIYCLYKRIEFVFVKNNIEMIYTLFDPVPRTIYDRQRDYIKEQCERIYNEIESHWYTFTELVSYWTYKCIWDEPIAFDTRGIDAFMLQFTDKQLEIDRRFIGELNKQIKFKNISEYFVLRENGESLIYELMKNKHISIYFCIFYLTSFMKQDILNKQFKRFIQIIKLIQKHLNLNV